MSVTQADPLRSVALRIANVLSGRTRENAASNSNATQFAAQLSAIWSAGPDASDMAKLPVNKIEPSSPDINKLSVTSSYMQALKPRSGLVGTPTPGTSFFPKDEPTKALQHAPEQDSLPPSADSVRTTTTSPAADRRSIPPSASIASLAKDHDGPEDRPSGPVRVADNVKAQQVLPKPQTARKSARTDDQAPQDQAPGTILPASQPGATPQTPPEPPPVSVTSVSVQSANARPVERLSTPETSRQKDRTASQLPATAASSVAGAVHAMPTAAADVPEPFASTSGPTPTEQGAGIPVTVAFVSMAPATAPQPVVAAVLAQNPTALPDEAFDPPVDETAPTAMSTKLPRSSSAIGSSSDTDPPGSQTLKDDVVLPVIVPIAPIIPLVTAVPAISGTEIVMQARPAIPLPDYQTPPDLAGAGFGQQASAQTQVGSSLLTLASGPDGNSQMALTLHPKELGAVHVQLDRTPDGTVRIVVTASEPATLRSLVTDQAHLHAALDAASIPSAGRHLSFELGAPPVAPAATPGHGASQPLFERAHDPASASQNDARANVDMPGSGGSDAQAGGGGRDPGSTLSRSVRGFENNGASGTDGGPAISTSPRPARQSSSRINITA